jgi:uncharacterized protein with von Willebrand factor type A (vWA) domain
VGVGAAVGAGLSVEVDRLRSSCRRLLWLNPLLGYAGFEPRASGIRAILPHVDEHRPVHNLESLEQLADALGSRPEARRGGRSSAARAAGGAVSRRGGA